MKLFSVQRNLLVLLSILFAFAGCKQPETTVVEGSPEPTAPADTAVEDQKSGKDEPGFRQLLVGEYQLIRSLDPLLADNASSLRAVQLVYEGLVRLDENGEITAGLARNWKVSDDSLKYVFQLRPDIYYQDSDVFSTGTGRRVMAKDIKYVFERMAQSEVPPRAAQMFMAVEGFDAYYQEQRMVYNPEERNLSGISGISTPDETTVVFQLNKRDPQFLKKLATPLAVIYPKEAVGQTVSGFTPVGAGPFQFSKRTEDSTFVFSKFQNYYGASDISLNRIDVKTASSESDLFQAMGKNELYLLPQLGPQLMQSVLSKKGELLNTYAERYTLQKPNATIEYELHHNPNANLTTQDAQAISGLLRSDSASYFEKLPSNLITTADTAGLKKDANLTALPSQLYSVYSDDPFVRNFLGFLSKSLSKYNISLKMKQIRVPSKSTALFFSQNYPLISGNRWKDYPVLYRFAVQHAALQRSEIEGLDFNRYAWWFDVRGVTLPSDEKMVQDI